MSIFKFMVAGAAIGYGIYYITKEQENGKSILDDIIEDAPEYADRAKKYVALTVEQIAERFQAAK